MDENLSFSNESDYLKEDFDNLENDDGVSLESGYESNMEGGQSTSPPSTLPPSPPPTLK